MGFTVNHKSVTQKTVSRWVKNIYKWEESKKVAISLEMNVTFLCWSEKKGKLEPYKCDDIVVYKGKKKKDATKRVEFTGGVFYKINFLWALHYVALFL